MAQANDATIFVQRYKYSQSIDLCRYRKLAATRSCLKGEGKVQSIAFVAEDTLHSTGALRGGAKKALANWVSKLWPKRLLRQTQTNTPCSSLGRPIQMWSMSRRFPDLRSPL